MASATRPQRSPKLSYIPGLQNRESNPGEQAYEACWAPGPFCSKASGEIRTHILPLTRRPHVLSCSESLYRLQGLNLWPPACKAGTLPTELKRRMESAGLEPAAFCLQGRRSSN